MVFDIVREGGERIGELQMRTRRNQQTQSRVEQLTSL